ncbi:MAG: hypothetical protein GF364_19980 [Candidatus Lokiarchaeota archaeon]|nr:hypothetical protein [Candidatus Lokiarchaeota archaeon]
MTFKQDKKTSKEETKKIIYIISWILLLILNIFLLIDFYIVGTIIGFWVFFIFSVGSLRRQDFHMRFLKIQIIVLFLFILLNPNPVYWSEQISRRWMDNRTKLIEPNHSYLPNVNNSFQSWFSDQNGYDFKDETNFETQVRTIDEYIRNEIFIYTLDPGNYGGYMDHIPSMNQIIASKDGEGYLHDDCDGISIFTASFLIYLGFNNTYISEVTYHYHVMVFEEDIDPKTEEGYLSGISLYRGRVMAPPKSDKVSYYLFNQTEMFIPPTRPLYLSILEITCGGSMWMYDVTELFNGKLFGLPPLIGIIPSYIVMGILIYAISLLAVKGLMIFVEIGITQRKRAEIIPRNKLKRKKNIFIIGTILFSTLFLCNIFSNMQLSSTISLTLINNPILISMLSLILYRMNKKNLEC